MVNLGSTAKIGLAVTSVRDTAKELNKLGDANVSNVSGVLNSVRNALNQLKGTLSSMGGSFRASATGIGAGIKSGIVSGMSGLSGEVNAQASAAVSVFTSTMTTGGTTAGTGARTAFQGSFKLASIAQAEMNYAVQAVNSGAGALANAARRAAEQAVAAAKAGADAHSPGAIARMWGQEFGEYSPQKIIEGSGNLLRTVKDTSQKVVSTWGTPQLRISNPTPTPSNIQNMGLLSRIMPQMQNTSKTIIFNITDGAFRLDARNLTQPECQKIVTLGLEGIRQVNDVNIRGVR